MAPIILEVNIKNIIYNYNKLKKINSKGVTSAVVKANAYGTGVDTISKLLVREGCKDFFVATIEEAIDLRKKNKNINIYILNGINRKEIKQIIKYKIKGGVFYSSYFLIYTFLNNCDTFSIQ